MTLKFDDIKKLHQKKYRNEFGHFLVEGEHLALELEKAAKQHPALQSSQLFVTAQYQDWPSRFTKNIISEKQMAQITDTKTPQGIIAVAPILSSPLALPSNAPTTHAAINATIPSLGNLAVTKERAIYLYEIQDPGNLGTILRTLAWFGNFRCLLSPGSVDPYNPKVVRASMGAIFHVPMELDVSLDNLQERFNRIACLDMQGKPLSDADFSGFDCYLFGNEARGVPREHLDRLATQAFTIQGCGAIESLNLATAVNLCVYELKR